MAMGDAIAVSLLIKKGLNEKRLCPVPSGGSIGRNSLIKVEDLMHSETHFTVDYR